MRVGEQAGRGHAVSVRTLLGALVTADVAYAFLQTAIIPAIPTVRADLGMSQAWSAWLLSAYLMLATVATPALGRLADLYGRKRLLLLSLLLFLVGAVGGALAPDTAALLVFRALQGAGGAVFPLTFAVVREHLPAGRVSWGIGALTGSFGIGTALGFGLGGLIAQAVSWRLIFGAGAVAVGGGALLVARAVPGTPPAARGRFDTAGACLVGSSAVALLLALTLGVQRGWAAPATVALFAVSAGTGAWWVRHELSSPDPLIDLRVLRTGSVALANLATLGLGWALFGTYLLLPELARAVPGRDGYGFGVGATLSGLYLLPAAIGQLVAGPLAARLGRRWSMHRVFAAGLALLAAALAVLATTSTGLARLLVAVFVLGAGAGLAIQASSTVVTAGVPAEHAGVSSTLNSTVRRLAGGCGSQVSVAILAALPLAGTGSPSHTAFTVAFAVAAALAALGCTSVVVTTVLRRRRA